MKAKTKLAMLPMLALSSALTCAPLHLQAQTFASYPEGDDVTTSLGQFQIVLDQVWRPIFDIIMTNSPLANVSVTRHIRLYHRGVLTSPTLYDPTTIIGRSDPFVSGGSQEAAGTLAGQAPGRTYIKDGQLTALPSWAGAIDGVNEVHTFIKSMHLTDSFTTRVGFSVKAGMLAPTRPVSAGQVEAGSLTADFPANSFFNVYVVVDLPAGGLLPPIQLVNVDPLLVQHTNIFSFPPKIVYQHENPNAVPIYFNSDTTIIDPISDTPIHVARGTLFGQLTLAGHGVGFGQAETESFQAEFETESENGTMPLVAAPVTSVVIQDFAPDYNAGPSTPALSVASIGIDGSFSFSINHLMANTTNYIQVSTDLAPGNWQTIATFVPTTNTFTFVDTGATNNQQRFYRWLGPQ